MWRVETLLKQADEGVVVGSHRGSDPHRETAPRGCVLGHCNDKFRRLLGFLVLVVCETDLGVSCGVVVAQTPCSAGFRSLRRVEAPTKVS